MNLQIRDLAILSVNTLCGKNTVVHEFGSRCAKGQEHLSIKGALGRKHIGYDLFLGKDVDRKENLHNLTLSDDEVEFAICLDTLEHVRKPWIAISELHRIIKPGGILVTSTPWRHKIHNHPNDYWRYTPECMKHLLSEHFRHVWVGIKGSSDNPDSVISVASSSLPYDMQSFINAFEAWKQRDYRTMKDRIYELTPPALIKILNNHKLD